MKLQVVSDLHLEFGTISIKNAGNTDVLILSGDICVVHDLHERDDPGILGMTHKSNMYHEFFQNVCQEFPHVIYVCGNHEHYHGDFATTFKNLKRNLSYLKNLYVMEKEVKVIDDVTFVAGTLWTDMNKEDPITINRVKDYMNDYRIIEDSSKIVYFKTMVPADKPVGMTDEAWIALPPKERSTPSFVRRPGRFSPEQSVEEHKEMLKVLREQLAQAGNSKVVVVGHHAPSKLSTKPMYERDVHVNGAYSSDLSELILDNPCIKLWTHGHTHSTFDYTIGSTRIVCNPRGYYNYEENYEFDPLKVIEI